MKRKDIVEALFPGVFIGLVLGFSLTMLVGVNETDMVPNIIGGIMCCFLPTLLNTTVVLKMTAKKLKRDLPVKDAIFKTIRYTIMAGLVGFLVVAWFLPVILGIDPREISTHHTALYQAALGVIISTGLAYLALKRYEKSVKYKRRKKKETTKEDK